MGSQCFLLDTSKGRTRLHMSAMSTVQALMLVDPQESVALTGFAATDLATNAWLDLASLPPLDTVGSLTAYLSEQEEALVLVSFSVRVGSHTEISTHDDG